MLVFPQKSYGQKTIGSLVNILNIEFRYAFLLASKVLQLEILREVMNETIQATLKGRFVSDHFADGLRARFFGRTWGKLDNGVTYALLRRILAVDDSFLIESAWIPKLHFPTHSKGGAFAPFFSLRLFELLAKFQCTSKRYFEFLLSISFFASLSFIIIDATKFWLENILKNVLFLVIIFRNNLTKLDILVILKTLFSFFAGKLMNKI